MEGFIFLANIWLFASGVMAFTAIFFDDTPGIVRFLCFITSASIFIILFN